MDMIKPDWNKFKAKFSDNPQNNFEWFCYLLFCQEYNKPYGIFRFKNQSGIETNPIIKDNDIVGWQAKFYETTLSDHKNDLIDTVERSKRDYSNLTKIILYTNQEWGQGKKQNEPQAKIEIEQKANKVNIEIEWRTASFFESSFVAINNNNIAQYFFSFEKSIIHLLAEKQAHTESILYEIQTNIEFNNQRLEIDRNTTLKNIQEKLNYKQILIISGLGGVGKTAVIKRLYTQIKGKVPFYVFKASEFEINNVEQLFNEFGLKKFIEAHKDEENKIIVIDSAEKLLDIQNTDPIKEFLYAFIQNNWKIVFTTRNNYLEDLNYQFIEIHKIVPFNLDIQNLYQDELKKIAQDYNFLLPNDFKLLELIKNPFYLNEFLKHYKEEEKLDYLSFKKKLWNNIIKKGKPEREQCFLKIAFQRASQGQFFVISNFNHQILNQLVKDGILGYEVAGYFITHDIYEEWALENIIEAKFINKSNNKDFFEEIGESLAIRRSFRNWLSEHLLLNSKSIKQFIEEIIQDDNINFFWKDEILISVLLSEYSEVFFELFKEKILETDYKLMKKIAFLLRIACKEIDNLFYKQLGIDDLNLASIEYFLTKPKGKGWQSFIKFVYNNLDTIKMKNLYFILPIIYDWNKKNKNGETVRISSLIALKYYEWVLKEKIYFSHRDQNKENLFQTILYGSSEIKVELSAIFGQILENHWNKHNDPYYDLVEVILTKTGDNIELIKVLPDHILKLAELYWLRTCNKDFYYNSGAGIEKYFGLVDNDMDYFPASAYQTPIYWLLQTAQKKTIEFFLSFTNKTVKNYFESDMGRSEIDEIDVYISDEKTKKQYICNRLWNTYRGTQGSPYVLESMHMAIEKFFIERAKNTEAEVLEYWLFYMLENTMSASITAIVVSVVLAYPEKTFNVAAVLFQTKEFFSYDTSRMILDQTAKTNFSFGYGLNYEHKIHQDERIKTCDDKHRQQALENVALSYQFFRSEGISAEEAEKRQQIIWSIFDKYYRELPDASNETESDKTWRLYLARMDRRKMRPTTEKKDGQILINFNPEIDTELKEYSEESIKKSTEYMKYASLSLWADYKMRNDERYKQYENYENNFELVLQEVKEIIECIKNNESEKFYIFNNAVPGNVCSVLIREYLGSLSKEEKVFCKDIILGVASSSFRENYTYQIYDSVESAISVLPILLKEFPEEKEAIKVILLLTLFDHHSIGSYCDFADYAKKAILNLWEISFEDSQSLLLGYLLLKPEYEKFRLELRQQNIGKNNYQENQVIKIFLKRKKSDLDKVINNQMLKINLKTSDIENLNLYILKMAFQLLPLKVERIEHKELCRNIISVFAKKTLSNDRKDKVKYKIRHDFLEKLAYTCLNCSQIDTLSYLKPFLDGFNRSESIAEMFEKFISAEDKLATYDHFWYVWNLFYEKVVELCKDGEKYWCIEKIIRSYLFAETFWSERSIQWHPLKERNKIFFKKVTENMGYCPSVLFSISKLLNNIGNSYLNDGILWLSNMLSNNGNLWADKLEEDTIYYLERLAKKYIFLNRERIKKSKQLREQVLVILDFLISKGSVTGYLLRENIL